MTREAYRLLCRDRSKRMFGKRDAAMYARHLAGDSMQQIGERYGVSRQRAHVIVSRIEKERKG